MKVRILNISIAFFGLLFLFTACEKNDNMLEKQMNTWEVRNITSTSAELSGMIVADGTKDAKGYKEVGVCWSKQQNPTIANAKASVRNRTKSVYWVKAERLEHLTKYYAKAYAISSDNSVTYGKETSFTTLANVPYVSINAATDIEGKSVKITYNLTSDGKDKVKEKGICWSTKQNPTTDDNTLKADNQDIGIMSFNVENLMGNTVYFVRAYATNGMGTAYSKEISFTTQVASPTLTTDSTMNVTKTTVDAYGTVVADGGADVTERGFCWGTSENPEATNANKKVAAETGKGSYNVTIENLSPGTEYFIRAYAVNAKGVAYGNNVKVKTVTDIQKLYVPGGYQAASGYGEGDWKPENAPFIMNTKDNKVCEGYVYFANASEFKLTSDPDWNHTNYGDGGEGKLSTSGGNLSVAEAGVYWIKADLVNLTYSATKVDWRLIGDAIGGWNDENEIDMVYNKSLKRLVATAAFVDGSFKMRANRDWNINFGDNGADGTLEYGGDNMPATAGTYTFMADLSNREYKGMLTQWGIIGDATGGWTDDIDMTADIANNTWTFTGDLTVGQIKFRANDGWDVNLGGDVNNLSFSGDNINIDEAGNYTIVLDLVNNKCTITKN